MELMQRKQIAIQIKGHMLGEARDRTNLDWWEKKEKRSVWKVTQLEESCSSVWQREIDLHKVRKKQREC